MRNHLKHVVGVLVAVLALSLSPLAGVAQAAGNDYPYRADTTQRVDPWTFTKRQCVSFAAWRLAQRGPAVVKQVRNWGNARDWDNRARAQRIVVSAKPRSGVIAQWNPGEVSHTYTPGIARPTGWMKAGAYGHVAFVRSAHLDGTVTIEQYNMGSSRSYSTKRVKAPRYLYIGVVYR